MSHCRDHPKQRPDNLHDGSNPEDFVSTHIVEHVGSQEAEGNVNQGYECDGQINVESTNPEALADLFGNSCNCLVRQTGVEDETHLCDYDGPPVRSLDILFDLKL